MKRMLYKGGLSFIKCKDKRIKREHWFNDYIKNWIH